MTFCDMCGENVATEIELCPITGVEWNLCKSCKIFNDEFESEFDVYAFLTKEEIEELEELEEYA